MDFANKSNIFETVKVKCAKTYSNVFLVFVVFLCSVMMLFSFLLTPKLVKGSSMYPTLNINSTSSDVVYILKQHNYSAGDIVVLSKNDTQSYSDVIKRIVAVGGDKVAILEFDGVYKVVVNNVALEEKYIASQQDMQVCYSNFKAYLHQAGITENYITLKSDEIFVLGDNRANSFDSSNYGPRKVSEVEGRVFLVVPHNKFKFKIIW